MYSYEDRLRAVHLYIKLGKRIGLTIRQLGYPTKNALKAWYLEYEQRRQLRAGYTRPAKYSRADKKRAVEHYLEHGRCIAATIKALGYPSRSLLSAWLQELRLTSVSADERRAMRQQHTQPVLDALHQWMLLQRQKVPEGSATAKALDYSLRRWEALTRFVDDGQLPIDNNWIENQIRPIALGRSNWLFAGSLRAGQRAAAVMSLVQSARMNGHDPYAYLKDVLTRLPTHKASQIEELLPHRWQPDAI